MSHNNTIPGIVEDGITGIQALKTWLLQAAQLLFEPRRSQGGHAKAEDLVDIHKAELDKDTYQGRILVCSPR